MAFVKLDCGILTSTLWMDRDAREVFITALLMAKPCTVNETEREIATRSLDETGWTVPPGEYGFVAAAGVGIIRAAGIERENGMDALERLAAPDPESRSKDFDGRRMVRVDHGFIVLNFRRYRDKDHTAAARQKRYRDRLKAETDATLRNAVISRNVTQAEAEAEAEVISKVPSEPLPVADAPGPEKQPKPRKPLTEQKGLAGDLARIWKEVYEASPEWGRAVAGLNQRARTRDNGVKGSSHDDIRSRFCRFVESEPDPGEFHVDMHHSLGKFLQHFDRWTEVGAARRPVDDGRLKLAMGRGNVDGCADCTHPEDWHRDGKCVMSGCECKAFVLEATG